MLVDGSTDKVIVEHEAIYILFLHGEVPKYRYLTVENIKSANAEGVPQKLRMAFERIGINNLEDSIVSLNADRASVNTGKKKGLGMLIKENAPWLELVNCFNHTF